MRGGIAITLVSALMVSTAGRTAGAPASRPAKPSTARSATTSTCKPATRRSPKTAEASRAAIRAAVGVLSNEFRGALSDPREHALRSSSNYFDKSAAEKIVPDVLLASLNFGSGDIREACYVNWQLLSGVPAPADTTTAPVLLSAYRAAPTPMPRPGVLSENQRTLDGLFKGKRMTDEADVAEQWQAILGAAAKANQPILAYRNELYHRLPKGFDTFAAAMDDLLVRMNAVVESKDRVKLLVSDVKRWASTESPPAEELSALAHAARKLADSKGPQYYVSASWRESSNAFVWRKSRTGIDTGHELKDLASFLDEQARQPVLKLDVKDRSNKN